MAAAVSNSSAHDELNSIIDSIELNIQYNLEKLPILIYVGIGTIAGRIRNDENNVAILDDENYHQFPPTLQKLYMQVPNLQVFCIYIDPSLENIPFITQDNRMKEKLNLNNWQNHNGFSFENNRITIYPFRQNIIVNSTKEYPYGVCDYVNITDELSRLHKICIENNCTYLYHDFSGNDNTKYIEKYFVESDIPIKNHLDHIIYGLGNGSINGCYYDFRKPEAHLAYLVKNTSNRPMISVFSINYILNSYQNQKNANQEDIITYLNEVIESFGDDNIEIITSIMCNHIDTFISQFRDYILYALRYIKDMQEKIIKGENPVFDMTTYGFNNVFDKDMIYQIRNIVETKNHHIVYQVADLIVYKYQFEFNILGRKCNMSGREFLHEIISGSDKYSWYSTFRQLYE